MMALRESSKFAVVAFKDYELADGKRAVELVPKDWLHSIDGHWFCSYPPEKDYAFVNEWVKEEKVPEGQWVSFEVELIKEAKNYEKGMKRLEKSYVNVEITSTESDDQRPDVINEIQNFNEDQVIAELENIPVILERNFSNVSVALPSSDPVDEANEGGSNSKRKLATQQDLMDMEKRMKKSFNSMKASIQYDMREFWKKIAVNTIAPDNTECLPPMPFQNDEDFQEFDRTVENDEEKKSALIVYMTRSTLSEDIYKDAAKKILKGILSKSVQLQYSACGRVINGKSKKNFSATNTFKIMNKLLEEKYPSNKSLITSYISRWFSGAPDRDGGKASRNKKD